MAALSAFLALGQAYHFMPERPYFRKLLWVLSLLIICYRSVPLGLGANGTWSAKLTSSTAMHHPIEDLVADSRERLSLMINAQSRSLSQATTEYERRYKRRTPPGFEAWYEAAVQANVTLIDEYNVPMRALEPFWGISPHEIRKRTRMALDSGVSLAEVSIKNHTTLGSDRSNWVTQEILSWLPPYLKFLPDMDLAINLLDEPRVIVQRSKLDRMLEVCSSLEDNSKSAIEDLAVAEGNVLNFLDIARQRIWEIATLSCPVERPNSLQRSLSEALSNLKFVDNLTITKDVCLWPEYSRSHGFFISPDTFKVTTTAVPIFSQAKPSSFQDVLFPSVWYTEGYDQGKYNEQADTAWENKTNRLYWTGSTTGGHGGHGNWHLQHRQRFVKFANDNNQEILLMKKTSSGNWDVYTDTMASISDMIYVRFTAAIQCEWEDCQDQKNSLKFGNREEPSEAYGSKYVFDLDGNGWSERFYRLLGSKSTVLKQSLFSEWHDDWLVPWVHFVPISIGMQELPEVIRFLALTTEGQILSANIAADGRKWAQTVLRKVDIELAFFRILLEYARLISDDREPATPCRLQ